MSAAARHLVPSPKRSVVSVELDGERVLYDTETGRLHQLDAIGSVVWSCFDGEVDLDELAGDLSEAFGADRGRVRADVEALARSLAAEGLLDLDGVVPDPVAAGDEDPGTPATAGDLAVLSDPPGG